MQTYLSVSAIILSMVSAAAAGGLTGTFVPIRLGAADLATAQVGTVVTTFALGGLFGCTLGGRVVRRVGHIRAFAAYASICVTVVLLLSWQIGLASWIPLRFIHGFCSNAMFMVAQSWLNECTPNAMRGRVMAFFYVSFTLAYGGGALVLAYIDPMTMAPFMIAGVLYALAVVPIATTLTPSPAKPERITVDLRRSYRLSPVGLIGAFVSGALGMTLQGVGPIYGTLLGLAPATIAILMACTQAGNLVIQWPLGLLSDRIDRRWVIVAATGALFVISLLLLGQTGGTLILLILLFAAFGGCAESLYSISTAHANDHAEAGDYVMMSSTLLMVWSLGATMGPIIATSTMSLLGPNGLGLYFAIIGGAFGLFTLWRRSVRSQPTQEMQEHFIALPQSPIIPEMNPNAPEP